MEAIQKIKQAEEKGEEIVAKAKSEAKDLIKEVTKEAALKYENIIKEGKEEAQSLIKKAEDEGRKVAEPILEKGKSEKEAILNMNSIKLDKAVNLIYERIVKSHGNS